MSPLSEYLNYYCQLEKPGFAVLVTGEWGTGKTFQVQSAMRARDYVYISLYNVSENSDIQEAIFCQAQISIGYQKAA